MEVMRNGRIGEVAKKCGDEYMTMIGRFVSVFSAPFIKDHVTLNSVGVA